MVIKNGRIIENNSLVYKDILIKNDIIEKIDNNLFDDEIIDVKGALIMPGGVDVHVHFREPGYEYKETIKTGSLAAAKGGFTTVLAMPNLNPVPDTSENLKIEEEIIKKDALINVYPYVASTMGQKGEIKADIKSCADRVYSISDDGMPVNNLDVLKSVMLDALKYDLVLCSHSEDKSKELGSAESEYSAVRAEIKLAKEIGCRYHFCHLSTKESYDAIRKARKEGYKNITCEVSPHHLTLNKGMMLIPNGNFKMNPPLRAYNDMDASIKALIDGTVDLIATDHAPHSEIEKQREYSKCPNGIIGLETSFPIIYTQFVKTGLISLDRFLDLMVYNPIKIFKLPERKLKEGYKADICVLDIDNPHIYEKKEILSKSCNSPFIGNEYYGFNILTICGGKIVYKKGA